MSDKDDEEEERQRQRKENRRKTPMHRWYEKPPATNKDGGPDIRSERRTGRVLQMNVKLTPQVRAMVVAIVVRDRPPSFAALFEEMVKIYLEKYGELDPRLVPSDEELAERMEEARFKDGK
jgi:hypothetical protein